MNRKLQNPKPVPATRRKSGLGWFVVIAALAFLGAQTRADETNTITPEQLYEGGTNTYKNWIELSSGGMLTSGYANQAEQGQQIGSGAFGGISDLHYETDVAKKTTLTLDGHSIFDNHDYSLGLGLTKENLGFVHFNAEEFRTWDAGTGGFIPSSGTAYSLPGGALALDRGNLSFEIGLTKPDLPQITFKYNHRYRSGDEGTTLWGPVHDPNQNVYRAYPGIYNLDERSDTFQLDLTHHYKKINYGAGVSYETGDSTDKHLLTFWSGEPVQQRVTDTQGTSYDMWSTHAFAESWLKKNLFLSTGFMYSGFDDTFSGSRIYGDNFDAGYSPTFSGLDYGYNNLSGSGHKDDYVLNVNLLSLPSKNWSIIPSVRVQKEDWNANSAGTATLGTDTQPFTAEGDRDSIDVCERLDIRYIGITNWVFTIGGQWTEGQGNLHETNGLTSVNGVGIAPVLFSTDDERFFQKYFANARWYPLHQVSLDFGGYYKYNKYDYHFNGDSTANDPNAGLPTYPGFLTYQGLETYDGYTRLTLRLPKNIMLVTRYEYQYSTISTRPDPASGLSQQETSRMNTHIIGQNASWTPLNWLGLQAGFNYVLSTTRTPASDYTEAVLNAQNNYWTVNFNSDFIIDDKTDLNIGYFYYRASDGQNNVVDGLPLGTDEDEHSVTAGLTHRITENLRLSLKYAFTHYNDYASANRFGYESHLIFASLQYRF